MYPADGLTELPSSPSVSSVLDAGWSDAAPLNNPWNTIVYVVALANRSNFAGSLTQLPNASFVATPDLVTLPKRAVQSTSVISELPLSANAGTKVIVVPVIAASMSVGSTDPV